MNIERNQDLVDASTDLELLYTIPKFPAFLGCVSTDPAQDIVADMNFYIGKNTGMVQLNPILPLDVVYQTDHNQGATGTTWLHHHSEFAKFIARHSPKQVFEIGGSHGLLSQLYLENNSADWYIIEPNPTVTNSRAKIIRGWFRDANDIPSGTDMIVHSHVLEHIYDPAEFFTSLNTVAPGTRLCFSIPNLQLHLEKKFSNIFHFEHTYLCSEPFVNYWLNCYGFDIVQTHLHEDHSIFYSAIRNTNPIDLTLPPDCYDENSQLMQSYFDYYEHSTKEINAQLENLTEPVYLFGAHVFSQFQLAFGLDRNKIVSLLDNSKQKQGQRLYGTDLFVQSPQILADIKNPVVILRAGAYSAEIKQDIISNINPNTIFIE